jgi:predicted transcriptional regulator with HTH domain
MNISEYLKVLTKLYREGCIEVSRFQEMMIGKDIEVTLAVLGDVEVTMRDGVECVELTEKAREVIEELTRSKTFKFLKKS